MIIQLEAQMTETKVERLKEAIRILSKMAYPSETDQDAFDLKYLVDAGIVDFDDLCKVAQQEIIALDAEQECTCGYLCVKCVGMSAREFA